MTTQNGRAFNEWLRAQLKAKKMSQRQLAQQSGVDHSTISRLIRGDRMPSLGTATKLARGLRELRDDADTPQYLGLVAAGNTNPTARVEYALRADELLSEPQVRQIMEYYLAVRMRRYGRTFQPTEINSRRRSGTGARPRAGPPPRPARSGPRCEVTVSTVRPVSRSPVGNRGVTEHTPGHDPGSPSTIRVSGTANAGVWGAGVRDSRLARGRRPSERPNPQRPRARRAIDRDRPVRGRNESVDRLAEPVGRRDGRLGRAAARRADRDLEQRRRR